MDEKTGFIDDFGPLPIERPRSVEEIGESVRRATMAKQAVYPIGGRTQLNAGLKPTKPGIILDTRSLDAVLDYPARDMTVTVKAGLTIAALQRLLAAENQRLPIDVPRPEQATVGGTLAANVSGSRRFGFGTLRDYVLGMSTVNDDGQEVKAGGRVVKNVAGYDLPKLHIGAFGTLGVITQVTFKLRPTPESTALLACACTSEHLGVLLDHLHGTKTRPVSLDVLNNVAVKSLAPITLTLPASEWLILVGYEDNMTAVSWQVRQLMEEIAPAGILGLEVWSGACAVPLWQALTEFGLQPTATLSFKANLLPGEVAAFCDHALRLLPDLSLLAHAGAGIVRGHLGGDLTLERATVILKELQERAVAGKGNVVVTQCASSWKSSLPIRGTARGDAWLMRRVKETLDPRGIFNPGRFI